MCTFLNRAVTVDRNGPLPAVNLLQAVRQQVYVAQPESGLAGVIATLNDLCLLSIDALSGCHADTCGSQSSAVNLNAVMKLHHLLEDRNACHLKCKLQTKLLSSMSQ
jgi:hypothetical protein